MSICNVIKNYEIKCNDIIRKDYITQTLIDMSKKTKYNNYKCITYDEFLELEKNIIKLINNDIEINVLNELVNNLDINQKDNINNDDTNNENDEEIEISLLNSSNEDDIESDNKENDSIKKDGDEPNKIENVDEYKIPNLYSRLLLDGRFINYKEIIKEFIKEKSYKRSGMPEELDEIIIPAKVKKIKYPKD